MGLSKLTFKEWLFGGIENPFKAGQWGPLHIAVMVSCVALIIGFYFIVKYAKNQEKAKKIIVYTLIGLILFFEILIRYVRTVNLLVLAQSANVLHDLCWIMLPRPWCAIACILLIVSVFVKKPFFYNFASLSALLCSFIFFCYPGVGFNNVYLLFDNWYSILTHSLLLTTSITLIVLKFTSFKFKDFGKLAICFALTFIYGLIQIYVLKIHNDPMYFMPHGDIQEGILHISYGLYLFGYIAIFLTYITLPHILDDKETFKKFTSKFKKKEIEN